MNDLNSKKMKKIYIGLFWACILGITGCYEDDSTMATPESMVNEITIEEFADTSAVAYSTVLELTPKVTGYSDTELEYIRRGVQRPYGRRLSYRANRCGKKAFLSCGVENRNLYGCLRSDE